MSHIATNGQRARASWRSGSAQIAAIDGAIAVDVDRNVEIADLLAAGDAGDLVDRAVVAGLHLLGILDDLVDEVAEMEHETELVVRAPRARPRRSSGDRR